jgi:hypothetical protein
MAPRGVGIRSDTGPATVAQHRERAGPPFGLHAFRRSDQAVIGGSVASMVVRFGSSHGGNLSV